VTIKAKPDLNGTINSLDKVAYGEEEQMDLSDVPDFGYIIAPTNVYQTTVSSTAKGCVIEIPKFAQFIEIEAGEGGAVVALLADTEAHNGATPHFANDYNSRFKIQAGTKRIFSLNSSCRYLYYSKTSLSGTDLTPSVTVGYSLDTVGKKKISILFIGSSGEQDMVAYVPPILNEVLQDYDIAYGDMYYSGAQAENYVNFYQNDTPCTTFNYWAVGSQSWNRQSSVLLEDVLEQEQWNIIIFKGSVTGCRQLMRIIQSIVTYPVSFATIANIPRVYDNMWADVIESTQERCGSLGFIGWIPVCTAMQNARSNDVLKMTGGVSCPEPTEFTIPAGRYFSFYHKIRQLGGKPATIKATRLSGDGTVQIYASASATSSDNLLLTLSDETEQTTTFAGGTDYIKIVNGGSQSATVVFEDSLSSGDYMLYQDNQHTQAGIPELISAYTIVLKLLEWTGNSDRGVGATSFLPTWKNLYKIGAASSAGLSNGLGHGYSCGVEDYIGSDGNTYDRSELTDFSGTLYVTTTVFDNTPDANSVSAVLDENNPVKYINIYAAQEVAVISVNSPDELVDCSDVVIQVPQKNQQS
jgi:hypothetical protein